MSQHKHIHPRVSYRPLLACVTLALIVISSAQGQTTQFTYQGRLIESGNLAGGAFDMQFKLFDTAAVGTGIQLGPTLTYPSVQVQNGIFTVELDFAPCANCFDGSSRFLEISIRPMGSPDPRTVLSPRQPITSAPYALRSLDASQLGGIAASGFIQNTTMTQPMTNFNIGGNGTLGGTLSANIVKSATEYYVGNSRVLKAEGTIGNLFVGIGAGTTNTSGVHNSFFGDSAGGFNQQGNYNSFFGRGAGQNNTSGNSNAFFGFQAGNSNKASDNSFFGANAGILNTFGASNAFFGKDAGQANQTGNFNAFFGVDAGRNNTASNNSFFGTGAGFNNTNGTDNAFFGKNAGQGNQTGNSNAFFGTNAGLNNTASDNSFFGAFAGDANTSGTSNAFFGNNAGGANQTGSNNAFFGSSAGALNTASFNSFFGALAGQSNTTACCNSFFGQGAGGSNSTGGDNAFFGTDSGHDNMSGAANAFFGRSTGFANTIGGSNSFFGFNTGRFNVSGNNNSFFGRDAGSANLADDNAFFGAFAGDSNTTGGNNTIIGANADVGANNLAFATAIGAGAVVGDSNSVVLGRSADTVRIPGTLVITTLGAATATPLCIDAGLVSNCSSSLRYKDHLVPFTSGLDLISKLRPITFHWKQSRERDLGLAAEEVAEVEPLLVTYNERGQVEGVKYDRITVALINAIRQQQAQISQQRDEIKRQQAQIDLIKKVVCLDHPNQDFCISAK